MKTDLAHPLIISVVPTLITMSLIFLKLPKKGGKGFYHLAEFFASMIFMNVISYITWTGSADMMALGLISWLWPLRTMHLICQDLTGVPIVQKDHYVALLVGVAFSCLIFFLSYEELLFSAPFAVSVSLVGLSFLYQTINHRKVENMSPLCKLFLTQLFLFIVTRASYPIWIMFDKGVEIGFIFDCLQLVIFNVSLFPLYVEQFTVNYLENALNVRNQQLFNRSSFSEFKILSAGIGHEINNALTVINAKTEQLMRVHNSPEEQKGLRMILTSADRIGKSIKGLREFIYPHKGQTQEIMTVKELLDNVLMLYGQRLRNHGAFVTIHGNGDKRVRGNRIQLEQVILSLINNAMDVIDNLADKWIEITCEPRPDHIEVFIKDSSAGLDDTEVEDLLDPSESVRSADDKNLGLILAKDIVEKHGGSLNYVKGSSNRTFKFELPVIEQESDPMRFSYERENYNSAQPMQ